MKTTKKLFGLLLLATPMLLATSCSDSDKDVPDVTISAEVTGAYTVPDSADDTYYVIAGDTLNIDGLYVQSNNKKNASFGAATYFWNGFQIAYNPVSPFGLQVPTSEMNIGRNLLTVDLPLLVVDYPVNYVTIQFGVVVVANEDELPDGAQLLQPTQTTTPFQYKE